MGGKICDVDLKNFPSGATEMLSGPRGGSRGGVRVLGIVSGQGFLLGGPDRGCKGLLLLPSVITWPSTLAAFLSATVL